MPTILRRLPFYLDATTMRIPDGPAIRIEADQIVVWVSIAPIARMGQAQSFRRFPALIDLGFNGFLMLREDHIEQWLKLRLDEEDFPFLRALTLGGENVPAFEADVWLYPNVPGFRDQIAEAPPLRLEPPGGIIVCPASMSRYRFPLLGVGALRKNRLRLLVNGEKRYISLRTPLAQN